MTVGLGTGSTVAHLLPAIARRGLEGHPLRRHLGRHRRTGARAGDSGRGVRQPDPPRHRDRRHRRGDARRLADQGRRRRPPAREDRRRGGRRASSSSPTRASRSRSLRGPVPLELFGFGAASTLARLGSEVRAARRAAQPRRRRDRRLPRRGSTTRRRWRRGWRPIPASPPTASSRRPWSPWCWWPRGRGGEASFQQLKARLIHAVPSSRAQESQQPDRRGPNLVDKGSSPAGQVDQPKPQPGSGRRTLGVDPLRTRRRHIDRRAVDVHQVVMAPDIDLEGHRRVALVPVRYHSRPVYTLRVLT